MDLFDLTLPSLRAINLHPTPSPTGPPPTGGRSLRLSPPPTYLSSLAQGLAPLKNTPTLVLGVQSDFLFPVEQQRELADALRMAGNDGVRYYELGGVWGHDTFL